MISEINGFKPAGLDCSTKMEQRVKALPQEMQDTKAIKPNGCYSNLYGETKHTDAVIRKKVDRFS